MTGKIFINYRRGDDPGHTGRLFDRLQDVFEPQQLFLDVDNIAPGLDFVRVLNERVAECDIVLAVIGKGWIDSRDPAGKRRLDDPDDFVRIEILSALAQGKRVIPVLVGDSQMPRPDELPDALQPLARRNAVRLTHERFRADVQGLIKALQNGLAEIDAERRAEAEAARRALAEEERRRREAEAARLAEEERKRQAAEAKRVAKETARRAEEEALRKEAERQAQERAAAERRQKEEEARQRAESEHAFAAAKRAGTIAALDAFLATHPANAHIDETRNLKTALLARADAYGRAAVSDDHAVLKLFIAIYKKGEDVDQVRARLRVLAPQQSVSMPKPALFAAAAIAAVLLAGAGFLWFQSRPPMSASQPGQTTKAAEETPIPRTDDVSWSLLKDTTDEAALYRFIGRYPTSPLRKDAEARIAELEVAKAAKAKADAEAAAKAQAAKDKADTEAAAKALATQQALDAERAKAAAVAEAAAKQQALAALPDGAQAGTAQLSTTALIQTIKMELTRVGCYAGKLDDDWTSSAVKQSIMKFVKAANLAKVPDNPTPDFLDSIRGRSSRVCPLECAKTEKELNGTCVAKTCPSGQTLDGDGDCETPGKVRNASQPAPSASERSAPADNGQRRGGGGGGGGGGNNRGAASASEIANGDVGIICNKTGCHTKRAHAPPAGVPCAKAIQDRMGAWHCS